MTTNEEEDALRGVRTGTGIAVGTWVHRVADPTIMHVLGAAGLDYVFIDMEHGSFSIQTVGALCMAAKHAGIAPIVRIAVSGHAMAARLMDSGARGILAPHIESAAAAQAMVDAVKFPPEGHRGAEPPGPETRFRPVDPMTHMRAANAASLILVQIESRAAVANLDEILAVPGVDGATVGRGDLALDLGVPGRTDHPDVADAVRATVAACERHGKIPALLVEDEREAAVWLGRGVRMLTIANEVALLRDRVRTAVDAVRTAAVSPAQS